MATTRQPVLTRGPVLALTGVLILLGPWTEPCSALPDLWPPWEWGLPDLAFWDRDKPPSEPTLYLVHPAKGNKAVCTSTSDQAKAWVAKIIADANAAAGPGPNLVIVVHGWVEGGTWFRDMASAMRDKVNSDRWICGWYDWRAKAAKRNPTEASQLCRQTLGPALGLEIVRLSKDVKHVHLIGHSAGAWLISEAAQVVARDTAATVHLTFLDAFIPPYWHEDELGTVVTKAKVPVWADHYFTGDGPATTPEKPLTYAHNVDLTKIDVGMANHRFSLSWYQATVTGRYAEKKHKDKSVPMTVGQLRYGFERSLQAGQENWQYSIKCGVGNEPVVLISSPPANGTSGK